MIALISTRLDNINSVCERRKFLGSWVVAGRRLNYIPVCGECGEKSCAINIFGQVKASGII